MSCFPALLTVVLAIFVLISVVWVISTWQECKRRVDRLYSSLGLIVAVLLFVNSANAMLTGRVGTKDNHIEVASCAKPDQPITSLDRDQGYLCRLLSASSKNDLQEQS